MAGSSSTTTLLGHYRSARSLDSRRPGPSNLLLRIAGIAHFSARTPRHVRTLVETPPAAPQTILGSFAGATRTLKEIEYAAAHSVDEAIGLLAARGDKARILAGGTDILVQLREGLRDAELIVDVKKIPDLVSMAFDAAHGLRLGASVPCYRIYRDAAVAAAYPALADSARIIGGWQIQSRGSIGGNLCNSSPAADSIPALIALAARAVIAGPDGRRTVPVAEFCTAPGRNVLKRGELLVAIEFPPVTPHEGSRYLHSSRAMKWISP